MYNFSKLIKRVQSLNFGLTVNMPSFGSYLVHDIADTISGKIENVINFFADDALLKTYFKKLQEVLPLAIKNNSRYLPATNKFLDAVRSNVYQTRQLVVIIPNLITLIKTEKTFFKPTEKILWLTGNELLDEPVNFEENMKYLKKFIKDNPKNVPFKATNSMTVEDWILQAVGVLRFEHANYYLQYLRSLKDKFLKVYNCKNVVFNKVADYYAFQELTGSAKPMYMIYMKLEY